jgi:hypothetical protein
VVLVGGDALSEKKRERHRVLDVPVWGIARTTH